MTLQSSGAISLDDIQAEFGGSAPTSLSEYYRGGAYVNDVPAHSAIPTSGEVKLADFYGQQYLPPFAATVRFAGTVTAGQTIDISSYMTTPTSNAVVVTCYIAGTNQGTTIPGVVNINGTPMDTITTQYTWAEDDVNSTRIGSYPCPSGGSYSLVIGTGTTHAFVFETVGIRNISTAVLNVAATYDHTTGDVTIARGISVGTNSTSVVLAAWTGNMTGADTPDVVGNAVSDRVGFFLTPASPTASYTGGDEMNILVSIDKNLA